MRQKDPMDTLETTKKPSKREGRGHGGGGPGSSSTTTANKSLITRNLRLVYDEVAGERIPDDMLDLLSQLGAKEERSQ